MKTTLNVSAAALLLAGTMVSGQASAAACSLQAWPGVGAYTCQQGDKEFSFEAGSTIVAGNGTFLVDPAVGGLERHTFTYTRTGSPPTGGTLRYTIAIIDDPLTPGNELLTNEFATVDLSAAVTAFNVTSTKNFSSVGFGVNEQTLTSVNGFEPAAIAVAPGVKKLWVTDTLVLDGTGAWNSFTNVFVQRVPHQAPEPGTLALLGLGLIGLAASKRRKV